MGTLNVYDTSIQLSAFNVKTIKIFFSTIPKNQSEKEFDEEVEIEVGKKITAEKRNIIIINNNNLRFNVHPNHFTDCNKT